MKARSSETSSNILAPDKSDEQANGSKYALWRERELLLPWGQGTAVCGLGVWRMQGSKQMLVRFISPGCVCCCCCSVRNVRYTESSTRDAHYQTLMRFFNSPKSRSLSCRSHPFPVAAAKLWNLIKHFSYVSTRLTLTPPCSIYCESSGKIIPQFVTFLSEPAKYCRRKMRENFPTPNKREKLMENVKTRNDAEIISHHQDDEM